MRLSLYSSKRTGAEPNLVAIQNPLLAGVPTVLVCPTGSDFRQSSLRAELRWQGETYIVACELARPIHRKVLRMIGEADASGSARIMETFLSLLAR